MSALRVAIVAYHHPESTLPLVKYLGEAGNVVDYYYVAWNGQRCSSAFDFGRRLYCPGIRAGNERYMRTMYRYMSCENVRLFVVVMPPLATRHCKSGTRYLFRMLGRHINRAGYDCVNIVGQNEPIIELAGTLRNWQSVFFSLHEVSPHYSGQVVSNRYVDMLLERGANIVVHSRYAERMVRTIDVHQRAAITAIPFGAFETYSLFDSNMEELRCATPYFLYFGNIRPYKGLAVLLDAVRKMGDCLGTAKIVVAGYGDDESLSEMKQDDRFLVINRHLTNEELVCLNQKAIAVVCPYTSASQSGIVCTAFQFGKPVIASDVGGMAEYITDQVNGLLVRPNDSSKLAEAMTRIVCDGKCAQSLCDGASRFGVDDQYSWRSIASRYVALFVK